MYLNPALVLLLLAPTYISADLRWRRQSFTGSGPPARRDAAIAFNPATNTLYLFGGRNDTFTYGDTWMFNMSSTIWTELPVSMLNGQPIPEPRFTIVFGRWRDWFVISTGEGKSSSGGREFYNDVYAFNFLNNQWTRLPVAAGEIPRVRYGASGGIHANGDHLFVTHGFSGTRYADTFKFDLRNFKWSKPHDDINQYDPFNPHPRCLHSGTMLSPTKMLLYGGCASGGKSGGPCPAQDNWMFDDSKKDWEELPSCASPRVYSSMAVLPSANISGVVRNVAVLYGGGEDNDEVIEVTQAPANEVTIFDERTEEWTRKVVLPDQTNGVPAKRQGHVMATYPKGIIMFGGVTASGLVNELWLLEGTAEEALSSKTPGSCQGRYTNFILVHGLLMFFGWGILLQLGGFVARYMKAHDPLWFHLHRIFQLLGLVFAIAGFGVGIKSVRFDHFEFAHGGIGLFIMIVGLLQPFNAIIRPHKDNGGSKSFARCVWEIIHKGSGRIALLLALANITLGLLLGVSHRGIWGVWLAYMCVLVLIHVIAEIRMRMSSEGKSMGMEMSRK